MSIDFGTALVWFAAFLFSTTVHEAMHALVAWRLGDPTAYRGGQVSLSPVSAAQVLHSGLTRTFNWRDDPRRARGHPRRADGRGAGGRGRSHNHSSENGLHRSCRHMALSRLIAFGSSRTLELRVEAFNMLNTFNWGPLPVLQSDRTHVNFTSGAFGRITSMAGTPRIMQFGIKYGF